MFVLVKENNNPKYTFNSNTSRLKAPQLARYMYNIVRDIINITPPSEGVSYLERYTNGRSQVDVNEQNRTLKGFWRKKGMKQFAECIIQHYELDFDRFWEAKSATFPRNKPYRCSCHDPPTQAMVT
jgi:FAD/FMN-containing dehydrogenase